MMPFWVKRSDQMRVNCERLKKKGLNKGDH